MESPPLIDRVRAIGQELVGGVCGWDEDATDLYGLADTDFDGEVAEARLQVRGAALDSRSDGYFEIEAFDEQNKGFLERLTMTVEELRKDVEWATDGVISRPADLSPAVAVLALAGGGAPVGPAWLTLSAITASTKYIITAVGGAMAYSAYNLWSRANAEHGTETVYRRTAATLTFTSLYYCALNSTLVIPKIMGLTITHQELVLHSVLDLITCPIVLSNLGHLAGMDFRTICGKVGVASAANICFIVAAGTSLQPSFILFGLGLGWLDKVASYMMWDLPPQARKVAQDNQLRVQIISDLSMWSWASTPACIALSMAGLGDTDFYVKILASADILGKLGATTVLMRHRGIMWHAHHHSTRTPRRNHAN